MDKRKKPLSKDAQRAIRAQFYADIESGTLSLSEAARQMRSISGLTQVEFAKHRRVSLKIIKDIEAGKGNPTIKTLNQIAEIFGLEVSFRRAVADS